MLRLLHIFLLLISGISAGYALPALNERIVVDIRIIDGFIVTEASVNGVAGNYIVDSGAPGLVLNSFDLEAGVNQCISVNQEFTCAEMRVDVFEWNHIKRKGITALLTDLSEIESAVGFEIHGLIGFEIFRKEKILINFSRQEIVFLPRTESNAESKFKLFANFVMPFTLEGSIPVMEYRLNGQSIRLGIDSGARSNVLDKAIAHQQTPDLILERVPIELAGVDASVIMSEMITLYNEDAPNPFVTQSDFVIVDLAHLRQSGYAIDGLVGPAFFENCLLLFDFQEMKIYAGFVD